MRDSIIAALALGAIMTLGDVAWDQFGIRHRVAYGVIHGAVMCLCLGVAIGLRCRRPIPAAIAGPLIGVVAAATFYLLAPSLRWGAMFPAWMLLWMLFALLQHRLAKTESLGTALVRGIAAALLSGAAFYAISGIWINDSHTSPNLVRHFGAWTVAFLPGFLALFFASRRRA